MQPRLSSSKETYIDKVTKMKKKNYKLSSIIVCKQNSIFDRNNLYQEVWQCP